MKLLAILLSALAITVSSQTILQSVAEAIEQSDNPPVINNVTVQTGDQNILAVNNDDVILIQGSNFFQSQSIFPSIIRSIEQLTRTSEQSIDESIDQMMNEAFPNMFRSPLVMPEVRLITTTGVQYNCSELGRWDCHKHGNTHRHCHNSDGLLCRVPLMDQRYSESWISVEVVVDDQSTSIDGTINQQTALMPNAFVYVTRTEDWSLMGLDLAVVMVLLTIVMVLFIACVATCCAMRSQSRRARARAQDDLARALMRNNVQSDAPYYHMLEPSHVQPAPNCYPVAVVPSSVNQSNNLPHVQYRSVYPAQTQTVAHSNFVTQPSHVYYVMAEPSAPAMV